MAQWKEPSVRDDDRLPWLESAEDDYSDAPAWGRVIMLVVVALAVVGAVVFGVYLLKDRAGSAGSGDLITAPAGDYKTKPDDPGGMDVDGEGTTALATSQGNAEGGTINLDAAPEAPVTAPQAGAAPAPSAQPSAAITPRPAPVASVTPTPKPTPTPTPTRKAVPVPASGGQLTATKPTTGPAPTGAASGSSLVQLGSFPSEADANGAWAAKSRRFGYLAPLGKSVEKAEVNGRTVYRLRVNAGSAGAAQTLCGKLKVAGEACYVPR